MAPGICTQADASLGWGQLWCSEPGTKAPASPAAMTSFSCSPAHAELARLIQAASCRQLAGIFASFNSQSSQEPSEGLSVFTEMRGGHGGQSHWELKGPSKSGYDESRDFSGRQTSGTTRLGSSHPACKQHARNLREAPVQAGVTGHEQLCFGTERFVLSATPLAQRCLCCSPGCVCISQHRVVVHRWMLRRGFLLDANRHAGSAAAGWCCPSLPDNAGS